MNKGLRIAFFGSSLVSAYWNGAATYYRGILSSMFKRGHRITFYEPDAYERQSHRDIPDPEYAKSIVYKPEIIELNKCLEEALSADIIIKASGVGILDEYLEKAITDLKNNNNMTIFWDVDAPATLERITMHPEDRFKNLIPDYDLILTYGGGYPVIKQYKFFGAKNCVPIYNALDPSTHFPVKKDDRFEGLMGFLGNRMPDREERVHEFFIKPAFKLPEHTFVLGGNGWQNHIELPGNVKYAGHVYTKDHNAFNCSTRVVLNISRDSMARFGFSPATRVFEAAGAGACIITDKWEGIELFLEPGTECLTAENGGEVIDYLKMLPKKIVRIIGDAAKRRILAEHTYYRRAELLEKVLYESLNIVKEKTV